MRGNWKTMVVVSVALWFGCAAAPPEEYPPPPPPGTWANVECPMGSGTTAWERLRNIHDWAEADGGPMALEARDRAIACRDAHPTVNDFHRARVFAAWTHADQARVTGDPALWQACRDELTHPP
ncbi:MAG: hypothetical protein ACYTF8_01760 [Planctomycetota bacterium]